ncbi:MAG TPA: HAD-IB family hydrolase [Ilumatobacter sp.]|nr:HAD-IB family hydrolase [Ilumatobacter sp.]
MNTHTVTIAAFDFDGTLSRRDSVVPFLRRFLFRWRSVIGILRHAPAGFRAVAQRDRDALRMAATAALLTGVPADEIAQQGAGYAEVILASRLRTDTSARLAWHRAQGHRVVFVSASYDSYLIPVAERLGVEAVLSTSVQIDANGLCTGRLHGANCRGVEKVSRLHGWLTEQRLQRRDVTVWAYGDSKGDTELLADADHPVWVQASLGSVAASPPTPGVARGDQIS